MALCKGACPSKFPRRTLHIPPFLGHYDQMPPEDVIKTQVIAALRIHIERAINKIKNFHI